MGACGSSSEVNQPNHNWNNVNNNAWSKNQGATWGQSNGFSASSKPKGGKTCSICGEPTLEKHYHLCQPSKLIPTLTVYSSAFAKYGPPQRFLGVVPNITDQLLQIKIFEDKTCTRVKWVKEPMFNYPKQLTFRKPSEMRHRPFQEKVYWLRMNMQQRRIPWQEGYQVLKLQRDNLLFSSKNGLDKVNLYKELKIKFEGEEAIDAGGLLRQWIHLGIKQFFSPDVGVLEICQTDDTAYRFKRGGNLPEQYIIVMMQVLGLMIGKAIFERISINCYLDRTIARQICCQKIQINDIYGYDKDIYHSWMSILNESNVEDIGLNFCAYLNIDGKSTPVELVPGGEGITVTQANKHSYIQKLIMQYCVVHSEKYICALRQSIYRIVPPYLLEIFQPHQFENILNGPNYIDIHDWKKHTNYKNYKPNDKVIKYFWEIVEKYDQTKLSHLLHYTTGSNRVPILGFKYLESNRNQVCQFTIVKGNYDKHTPYPKAYTCFNRLELPPYSSKKELEQRLGEVIEITTFGME